MAQLKRRNHSLQLSQCRRGTGSDMTLPLPINLRINLNNELRFIPFESTSSAQNLTEGQFDIAMAGIYVTRTVFSHLQPRPHTFRVTRTVRAARTRPKAL